MILQIVGFKKFRKNNLDATHDTILKSYGYTIATIKHHGHIGEDITLQEDHDHMKHFNAGADRKYCAR